MVISSSALASVAMAVLMACGELRHLSARWRYAVGLGMSLMVCRLRAVLQESPRATARRAPPELASDL